MATSEQYKRRGILAFFAGTLFVITGVVSGKYIGAWVAIAALWFMIGAQHFRKARTPNHPT